MENVMEIHEGKIYIYAPDVGSTAVVTLEDRDVIYTESKDQHDRYMYLWSKAKNMDLSSENVFYFMPYKWIKGGEQNFPTEDAMYDWLAKQANVRVYKGDIQNAIKEEERTAA